MENETTNDYTKYFDSNEYITKVIGIDTSEEVQSVLETENESAIAILTSLLTDPTHKDVKEITLLELKKEKKEELLLMAIANQKDVKLLPFLVAACWESEIDFSNYLSFFVLLALHDDYLISIEAITTINEMKGPFDQELIKKGISQIKQALRKVTSEKKILLNDLLDTLNDFSKAQV